MNFGEIRPDGTRERRRHVRRQVNIRAFLEAPHNIPQPCKVYNVSVGNALVGTVQPLTLGQPVVLHVESFGSISGQVARVTSTAVAIAFAGVNARALGDFIALNEAAAMEQGDLVPAA